MSELTHIAALTNPKIHQILAPVLDGFPWESEIAKRLSKEYDNRFHTMTDPVLQSSLAGVLVEEELLGFQELIQSYSLVDSTKDIERICGSIFDYYKNRKTNSIIGNYSEDINVMLDHLRDIPQTLSSKIKITNLGTVDIDAVIDEDIGGSGNVLPTNFKLIEDATPFKGYLPGQVVQWLAAPGVGKSAAMLYEILLMAMMGNKVLWVAMGDLTRFDFITRCASILTEKPYFDIAINPKKYFTDDVREVVANIDLIAVPSRTVSATEILELVENSTEEYRVVVADYDSNFKRPETGNMYDDGGAIYDILTEIARPENAPSRLVFVAAQPKINFWDQELLPEEASGESSRKQQIIDMMVTMGRGKSQHPCGIMHLPKVRRGKVGGQVPWRMTDAGKIKELTSEEYAMMKTFGDK